MSQIENSAAHRPHTLIISIRPVNSNSEIPDPERCREIAAEAHCNLRGAVDLIESYWSTRFFDNVECRFDSAPVERGILLPLIEEQAGGSEFRGSRIVGGGEFYADIVLPSVLWSATSLPRGRPTVEGTIEEKVRNALRMHVYRTHRTLAGAFATLGDVPSSPHGRTALSEIAKHVGSIVWAANERQRDDDTDAVIRAENLSRDGKKLANGLRPDPDGDHRHLGKIWELEGGRWANAMDQRRKSFEKILAHSEAKWLLNALKVLVALSRVASETRSGQLGVQKMTADAHGSLTVSELEQKLSYPLSEIAKIRQPETFVRPNPFNTEDFLTWAGRQMFEGDVSVEDAKNFGKQAVCGLGAMYEFNPLLFFPHLYYMLPQIDGMIALAAHRRRGEYPDVETVSGIRASYGLLALFERCNNPEIAELYYGEPTVDLERLKLFSDVEYTRIPEIFHVDEIS